MRVPGRSDLFIARQPILDRELTLRAYELLFRPTARAEAAGGHDPNHMASQVILGALSDIGLDELVGDCFAFVNVTREVLLAGLGEVLPPEVAVLELLEHIEPDAEVLAAVDHLRGLGYIIALDDYVDHPRFAPLLDRAHIVKIDVLEADLDAVAALVVRLRSSRRSLKLLAERVETYAIYERCRALGFDYFQGYFFARPQTLRGRKLSPGRMTTLRLLAQLADPEIDFDGLGRTISQDVSLCYRLLKYINSPIVGLRAPVRSVQAALVLLGERSVRQWALLTALGGMTDEGTSEAVVSSARLRAKLCADLAERTPLPVEPADAFTVGLFSLLDALLDRPMGEAVETLSLTSPTKAALVSGEGPLGRVLGLARACEQGDWRAVERDPLGLDAAAVQRAALDAVRWVERLADTEVEAAP